MTDDRRLRVHVRLVDAMREIGTLLLAFAPLDGALELGRGAARSALLALPFLTFGALAFLLAVWIEWRQSDV